MVNHNAALFEDEKYGSAARTRKFMNRLIRRCLSVDLKWSRTSRLYLTDQFVLSCDCYFARKRDEAELRLVPGSFRSPLARGADDDEGVVFLRMRGRPLDGSAHAVTLLLDDCNVRLRQPDGC